MSEASAAGGLRGLLSALAEPLRRPALADVALEGAMAAAIEAARVRHALGDAARWRPGRPLRLLLAGYLGTRNTGADVRVCEIIRQLRTVLGDEQLELTALTSDARLSAGYFPAVRQRKLPDLYVPFLLQEVPRHDGVVACEGSMFKSKFANALTTFMAGALGLAVAENKLAVGYGAEAGAMDPVLERFVARYCRQALVVVRNEASREALAALGVPAEPGTDTAWTFEPSPPARARALLREAAGWDGQAPLLVVCPINPFWWPVRPAAGRRLVDLVADAALGAAPFSATHYRSLYYHRYGPADRAAYEAYLDALARGVTDFLRDRPGAHLTLVGMERLDRAACEDLAGRLGGRPACLVSDEHDMYDLVGALRQARWLLSSRYHAIVCSMPARVPSLGVSMDERIANLMDDRRQPELCLRVGAPDLADRVLEGLRAIDRDADAVRAGIAACLPRQLELMGLMGITFEDELLRRYPDFPRREGPRRWERYLPPLSPQLEALL